MTAAFITFEGGEGSGKSTQLRLLEKAFEQVHHPYLITREPGGSAGAELIRNLLVTGRVDAWDPVAESLLFYAARADHVAKRIKPALAQGKTVISDRFSDSTMVYQGIGKGLTEDYIATLHHWALGNFMPDLTIILDIDPVAGLARAQSRGNDEHRFEDMHLDFHHRVRAGFLAIAQKEPKRCVVIDAAQSEDAVHRVILATIHEYIGISL